MRKAVFGVIGTGGIAQDQHIPNLIRAPHAELRAICDLDAHKLKDVQEKYAVPKAMTDYQALLSDPDIDAVVISTRPDSHLKLTTEALKAGKHVYVEKPLSETPQECQAILAAQEESGKHVAVGLNRRFAPAYVKAKEILKSHGGPRNIYYRISDELWARYKHVVLAEGVEYDNPDGYEPGTRYTHEVCHVFDILRWLADSEVATIYCVAACPDEDIAVMQFESGCVATIMSSANAIIDMPKERLEVIAGDRGGLTVEEFVELRTSGFSDCEAVYRFAGHTHPHREFLHKYLFEKEGVNALYAVRRIAWELRCLQQDSKGSGEFPDKMEITAYDATHPLWNYMVDKGWLWAIDHFAACIASNEEPKTATCEDGLKASMLAEAAIASRDSHKVVRLDGGYVTELTR